MLAVRRGWMRSQVIAVEVVVGAVRLVVGARMVVQDTSIGCSASPIPDAHPQIPVSVNYQHQVGESANLGDGRRSSFGC